MSFDAAKKEERQVIRQAQEVVMRVLGCNPIEASEEIRKRAETAQQSVINTVRSIAGGGVENFH